MPATAAPALRRLTKPLAACTVAYTVVLVTATHYPNPQELLQYSVVQSDKTLHFIAYGILGLLVGATLTSAGRHTLTALALALFALAGFAAADEATQPLFGRYADVLDWGYDCIGLAGGIALATTVLGWFSRKSLSP